MTANTSSLHGVLSTAFTPPASCTNSYAYDGSRSYSSTSGPVLEASYPQSSACFASGWTSASNLYAKGGNFWSGSPLCPAEQTVAQTQSSGTWTTAVCCSSGWGDVYQNENDVGTDVYSFYMCVHTWTTPATTTLSGSVKSGGIIVPSTATVTAPWQMESTAEYLFVYDRLTTATPSAVSSVSHTPTVGPSSSTASTAASPSRPGSLSAGAIAGLSVGLVAIVLLAGIGAWGFWKRHKGSANGHEESSGRWGEKPELDAQSVRMLAELPPQHKEADEVGKGEVRELAGSVAGGRLAKSPAELYVQPAELGG